MGQKEGDKFLGNFWPAGIFRRSASTLPLAGDHRYIADHERRKEDIGCPLSARKRKSRDAGGTSVMCHVWTAPCWQGFF